MELVCEKKYMPEIFSIASGSNKLAIAYMRLVTTKNQPTVSNSTE